jgi:hypothetical protein
MLLYLIFGLFFDYQIFKIVDVTVPSVLGTYGAFARLLFGASITFAMMVFLVLFGSGILWVSMRLGSFFEKTSTRV